MIEIKKVETKKKQKEFVKFLHKLYKGCENFVPPLIASEMEYFELKTNPSLEHCEVAYFLAYNGGEIVGRIGGIFHKKSNENWKENRVRFTRFDVIDDIEVTRALFDAVIEFGKQYGADEIHGPMGFNDFDQEGMLTEGFDKLPTFITLYNHSYYETHLRELGFKWDTGWHEYRIDIPDVIDPKIARIAGMIKKRNGLKLIEFTKKSQLKKWEMPALDLHSKAYRKLYGFSPLTTAEKQAVVDNFLGILNPEFIKIVVDGDDTVVGFGVGMPSLSKAAKKAKGRLFPGLMYLAYALKHNDTVDLLIIGVDDEYLNKGVTAIIMDGMEKTCVKYGIKHIETNPELETNFQVQNMWKRFGPVMHKKRGIFIKEI